MADKAGTVAQWAFGVFFVAVWVGGILAFGHTAWELAPQVVLTVLVLGILGMLAVVGVSASTTRES
jgi:uncharacterized transporter YbjL